MRESRALECEPGAFSGTPRRQLVAASRPIAALPPGNHRDHNRRLSCIGHYFADRLPRMAANPLKITQLDARRDDFRAALAELRRG